MHLPSNMALYLRLAAYWTGFMLLWLLFTFQISPSEILFGAVASASTVVAVYTTLRALPICFKPQSRWLIESFGLPLMVVQDLVPLAKGLLRAIARKPERSRFARTRFAATGDGCDAAAQRALTVLFISVTPNSVVLDIDREKKEMLFHQLEPAPIPDLLRRLQE